MQVKTQVTKNEGDITGDTECRWQERLQRIQVTEAQKTIKVRRDNKGTTQVTHTADNDRLVNWNLHISHLTGRGPGCHPYFLCTYRHSALVILIIPDRGLLLIPLLFVFCCVDEQTTGTTDRPCSSPLDASSTLMGISTHSSIHSSNLYQLVITCNPFTRSQEWFPWYEAIGMIIWRMP